MSKKTRIRGSSKAGRPKKAGDRYPSGKLKPPPPNARVLADRAALMASDVNLQNADNPMDLALARGWITERQHRAGAAFAEIRGRAGFANPCLGRGVIREVDAGSGVDRMAWDEMTDAEKTAVFVKAFTVSDSESRDAAQAQAMDQWLVLCAIMDRAEHAEVELICVHHSWPQWINHRVAGRSDTGWERKRDLLVAGLDKIARALVPKRQAKGEERTVADILAQAPRKLDADGRTKQEETTLYVDTTGPQLLEVVKRVRRPALLH